MRLPYPFAGVQAPAGRLLSRAPSSRVARIAVGSAEPKPSCSWRRITSRVAHHLEGGVAEVALVELGQDPGEHDLLLLLGVGPQRLDVPVLRVEEQRPGLLVLVLGVHAELLHERGDRPVEEVPVRRDRRRVPLGVAGPGRLVEQRVVPSDHLDQFLHAPALPGRGDQSTRSGWSRK
jgi:hypothetical protein